MAYRNDGISFDSCQSGNPWPLKMASGANLALVSWGFFAHFPVRSCWWRLICAKLPDALSNAVRRAVVSQVSSHKEKYGRFCRVPTVSNLRIDPGTCHRRRRECLVAQHSHVYLSNYHLLVHMKGFLNRVNVAKVNELGKSADERLTEEKPGGKVPGW